MFAEGNGRFRVETKSNAYREPNEELTLEQQELLSRIGWHEPTGAGSTPANDPHGSPNHFLDLTLPRNASKLLNVTVTTFTDVLGVAEPDVLRYEAFYPNGDSLMLPELCLKPLISQRDNSENPQLRKQLKAIIHEMTGLTSLDFDESGDLGPITFGQFSAYVRLVENDPYVRVYCPIIDDVEVTLPLFEKLNALNCVYGHMHFCVLNDCVTCVSDVLITPMTASYVAHGVANFLQICEEFGTEIRDEFGCYTPSNQRLVTH